MKQILQDIKNGETQLLDVPSPHNTEGSVLLRTSISLISAGTERMLIDFGKASYLQKVRQQPDKVKMVLEKIKTDGLMPTITAVRSKLDYSLPMGYSNVGVVIGDQHSGVCDGEEYAKKSKIFLEGQRVFCNGPHAEFVSVPEKLCVRIPDGVTDEEASFTAIGSISLQGVRLAQPTIGELFVVIGLGLIGQVAVQLLLANGCRVVGIDVNSEKCELASSFGAETVDLSKHEDPLAISQHFSRGNGVDGVLITAATKSSEPVHQAAQMCRKRGRIVLTGVTGLKLNRADFYEKELSFQVSCSYGPGRYDVEYEEKGHDYPIGFVRWTENRNFEAILDLMSSGKLNVSPLISHRFKLEDGLSAYEMIAENTENYLGVLLEYNSSAKKSSEIVKRRDFRTISINKSKENQSPVAAVIGAGNYVNQIFLPALVQTDIRLKTIASLSGISSTHLGKRFGFEESTTDSMKIFSDSEIDTVFITTRHDTHFDFVVKALESGKHVFVEKPLCLTLDELKKIKELYLNQLEQKPNLRLAVGFNRRFAPHIQKMKELLAPEKHPLSMIMTVNAGMIPEDHWLQNSETGGGRIIGEACHFIDLLRFLAGSRIIEYRIARLDQRVKDTATIQLVFENGSIGSIHYFSNGNKAFSKERLEVFCQNKILQMDNFKRLKGYGWRKLRKMYSWKQNKGHFDGIGAFVKSVQLTENKTNSIPFEEIVEVMEVTLNL
jgi:predicted dehydrogenase/threonine dehydrogenase-like Zn-dependent dehydrogenase